MVERNERNERSLPRLHTVWYKYVDKINYLKTVDVNATQLITEHFQHHLKKISQTNFGYVFYYIFTFLICKKKKRFSRLWGWRGSAVVMAEISPVAQWAVTGNFGQGQ